MRTGILRSLLLSSVLVPILTGLTGFEAAGQTYTFTSTLAGLAGSSGSADGTNGTARFFGPSGAALDNAGAIYMADTRNHTIRKITPVGVVTTLAGLTGSPGSADGTNSEAQFSNPSGVALDSAGAVYVADTGNQTIRKIAPVGTNWVVTTLAGLAGNQGSLDGTNGEARFFGPSGVALDGIGNVYVADTSNSTIRAIVPVGTNWVVNTLGGLAGTPGSTDGTNSAARFSPDLSHRD